MAFTRTRRKGDPKHKVVGINQKQAVDKTVKKSVRTSVKKSANKSLKIKPNKTSRLVADVILADQKCLLLVSASSLPFSSSMSRAQYTVNHVSVCKTRRMKVKNSRNDSGASSHDFT